MRSLLKVFAALAALAFPLSLLAAPGDLDSFVADVSGDYLLASAQQPDGKTIVVGTFTSVNGVPRNNVARLLTDGTVDPTFDPNTSSNFAVGTKGRVNAVAVMPDGKIVIGGFFTDVQPNGAPAPTSLNYIARLNADGTLDASFSLQLDNFVYGLCARPDGKLLLWGVFDSVLGVTRHKIARLNADGTLDVGFNPNPNDFIFGAAVQSNGKVLLAGGFTSLDPNAVGAPVARRCVARVNDDGTVDMGFDPSPDVRAFSVREQADGKVLLSGDFSALQPNGAVSSTPRNRIARVNADGTLDAGFNPDAPDFETNSVALQADGKVIFTGGFVTVQGTMRNRVARVDASGTLDAGFDPNLNNYALGVTLQDDGKVQLVGGFTSLQPNGAPAPTARSFFARLVNDPATQTLTVPDATQVLWQRGGSATEVSTVTFEKSLDNGATWTPLGLGTRVGATANWQLTGLSLGGQQGKLRARGFTAGGYFNGSSGIIGQTADFEVSTGFTLTPTLTAPASNAATKSPITVTFTLPEAGLAGTVKVKFGTNAQTLVLAAGMETAGQHSFTFDPANPLASSAVASIASGSITDGTYDVTLSYQDAAGNPAATAVNTGVKIDTSTQTGAGLGLPQDNGTLGGPFGGTFTGLSFYLPEAALGGSVKFTFDNGTTQYVLTTTSAVSASGNNLIYIKLSDPVGGSYVGFPGAGHPAAFASMTNGTAIPDGGPYSISFTYQDALGNAAVQSNVVTGVKVDTSTQTPTLTTPATGASDNATFNVSFTLLEDAGSSSVQLKFSNGSGTTTLVLADSLGTAGTHSFSFNPTDPTASSEITSGSAIADGVYSVALSYRDAVFNPVNSVTNTNVRVDTVAPTFATNFSPVTVFEGTMLADYTSQAGASDVGGLATGSPSQSPAIGTALSVGSTHVTISATDKAGNQSSTGFDLNVRPLAATHQWSYRAGDLVPDAGTVGGPPTGAKATTFGVPAIDYSGAVAYGGQWIGDDGKKGAGLFANGHCLGVVGADASATVGTTGAKWKSFTDPVIDVGNVVTIATLSGVPKPTATAVLSNVVTGSALEAFARAGDVAPIVDGTKPAGGAVFKSFKGVAMNGACVAFFAQLASGTTEKVTAANDWGLWLKNGTDPLRLVLREGQGVEIAPSDTRTIKTIVSFAAGNGSPGQGRGWLAQPYGPSMLALLTFTDKSQAVVGATGFGMIIFSRSGKTGGDGPEFPDSTFASYSFPTTNDYYTVAFLASMTVGAGEVTKADARGVFVSNGTNGYTSLARVGKPAGVNDANFSVLKDPVLAGGDGLAFLATLKGGTAKGLAASTLWWRPPGGALALLAQGGARPGPDLPADAQWKAFTSLAIAGNRGPIFAATLVPGKGEVTKATASGVWACDFNGAPRVLFRTGDPIDVGGAEPKTLKSFTLLKASVGSVGVTRSFSDSQRVVWLATFTDKTQAIITTDVP